MKFACVLLLAVLLAVAQAKPRSSRFHQKKPAPLTRDTLMKMSQDELVSLVMGRGGDQYWWYFKTADCGYDDVEGSCQGMSVDGCKQKCLNTAGCGGFNYPHGVLKKTDCLSHMAYESTVDLYVVQDKPQPPPPPPASNFPPIWPYPAAFSNGSTVLAVDPHTFKFSATTPSADLDNAFQRFAALFFPHRSEAATPTSAVASVVVSVADVNEQLQLESDESYTLNIPADGTAITVTAATVYGAYHGLQTLSQLIVFDFDSQLYQIAGAPWNIQDAPRFKHREVLVDSSRHFEPVQTLKNLIDSLTYAKINVVHWHIVDSQSFPFDSPTYPSLGSMGAYSPQERYTINDVADVIEYARARGVRVMIEIDNPGHAGSWCKGHPEVCPSPTCTEPLNPATNATFTLIDGLFRDLTSGVRGGGVAFDNMFHLGGDEVNTGCWTSTPSVAQWLRDQGLTPDQGYEYFVRRAQSIARGQGRDVVGWEEIWNHFGTELDKSTIIHQWLPGSTIAKNATAHGYRVLWSTDGVWYLDGLGVTWQTMYVQEPCSDIPDDLCKTLMLGGGGEMWGETVDTSDIQQTIWPRLAAIAERLWAPRTVVDPVAARVRFSNFRCLLNRRGVAAAPSNNPTARTAPPGPGGCLDQ